jgi:tetratricopeptide (TPR) repeat protein
MNVGKAILRVLRVFGIILLIPVVLVLLALLIGFITDLSVTPQWKQAQQASQSYFSKIKTQRYSAGVSFAILDANAWDYYARAARALEDIPAKHQEALSAFRQKGKSASFAEAETLLENYAIVFALLDSATVCRFCAVPLEYEKGQVLAEPSGLLLSELADLASLKGWVEVQKGKPREAAETYARILKMGADIAGGETAFDGQMVGLMIGKRALRQIANCLSNFDSHIQP